MIQEFLAGILLLSGAGFVLIAALGALRFKDSLTRMAAVSKASTLGLTLIFLSVMTQAGTANEIIRALLTIVIVWLTAPVAAHLLGRAALNSGEEINPKTKGTELIEELRRVNS